MVKALKTSKKQLNHILISLYSLLCTMYSLKEHVVVCCVPGHREIEGNVLADQLAASAHENAANTPMAVPALGLKPSIKRKLRAHWQRLWDKETQNKQHLIKPHLINRTL